MSPQLKQILKTIFRVVFSFGMLIFVFFQMKPQRLINELSVLNWWPLALAVIAQIVAKIVWVVRWKEILGSCGIDRKIKDLLAFLFIGLFFNSFLPTSVGGDIVRGYYVAKSKAGILISYIVVLVERVVGLISLLTIVSLVSVIAVANEKVPERLISFIQTVAVLGGIAAIMGMVTFIWSGWMSIFSKIPRLQKKHADSIRNLFKVFELFKRPDTPRFLIILNSFALQVIAILFYVACARAVNLQTPSIFFFLIVPVSIVAAMLPVSLNGLGIREGVFVGLLVAFGAPLAQSGAFAILALLISTLFSLAGGVIYLAYRTTENEKYVRIKT